MVYYRKGKLKTYLRPDSKSQVTVEYNDDRTPKRIHTIVVSTQHDDFITPLDDSDQARDRADEEMLEKIRKDVKEVLLPRVIAKLPENVKAFSTTTSCSTSTRPANSCSAASCRHPT